MTRSKSHNVPQFSTDRTFPYTLLCSTLGAVISLAAVWIMTAQQFAPVVVA